MVSRVVLDCTSCGIEIELPPLPERPGFVSIEPLADWDLQGAGAVRLCPECAYKPPETKEPAPEIAMDANGNYWRSYGGHYSMVPTSTGNEPIEIVARYRVLADAPTKEPTIGQPDDPDWTRKPDGSLWRKGADYD